MKEKSVFKMIIPSYGNMLLGGILCFFVAVSLSMLNFLPMVLINILLFIFLIPLYSMLIYSPIWTEADRNRNMVQFGHLEEDKFKGLKIGIFLIIPYLIANLVLTLSWCKVIPDIYPIYKIFNSHLWPLMNILNFNASVEKMNIFSIMICWLTSFYPLIVSVIAYFLGFKGISVSEKLIYKNKPRKKRRY